MQFGKHLLSICCVLGLSTAELCGAHGDGQDPVLALRSRSAAGRCTTYIENGNSGRNINNTMRAPRSDPGTKEK